MNLKLYNTLTRKEEIFKPIKKNLVRIYSCGPTVYWYPHIGNLRAYIFVDLLKRVIKYNGYKIKSVINITDVGHLTSDADEGEDRIERAAKKEQKTAKEISNFYFKVFKEEFKKLNIEEPDFWPKASEHIKEQIELIKKLEKKGYTYKTSDGIYFDSLKFKNYGKLSRTKVEKQQAGKRITMKEKRHPTDFALWKFSEKPGIRQQEWNPKKFGAEWPIGFPGWHLECSAMSMKYLGEHFDIHTGGQEHVQIHHQNEIAEAEAATGKKFVNYWLHNAWLTFRGEKVSKSKGGLYTLSELEKMGFDPLDLRYLCLNTNYRTQLEFSVEALKSAQIAYNKLKERFLEVKSKKDSKGDTKSYENSFLNAINEDLNIPKALGMLWGLIKDNKIGNKQKYNLILKFDKVFGLRLEKITKGKISKEVKGLAEKRLKARLSKNYKKADSLRELIKKKGYYIDDVGNSYKIKRL